MLYGAVTLATVKLNEHVETMLSNYEVGDPNGNLPYLTKVTETTAE